LTGVYVDTSALVKWYVNEVRSEEVEAYLAQAAPAYISLLTKTEMRSLLARRGREGHLDADTQARVVATFEGDIAMGHLVLVPHTVESFLIAESIVGAQPAVPLRALDALHLGVARANGIGTIATADRVMAQAAGILGLDCRTFF
jgi:hypothetical protein